MSLVDSKLSKCFKKTVDFLFLKSHLFLGLKSRIMNHFLHILKNITKDADRLIKLLSPGIHLLLGATVKLFPLVSHSIALDLHGILLGH